MPASRRRLATALVMLMLFAPFASAGVSNWTISSPISPDEEGITVNAFRVPSNQTIVDGWIGVSSDPMATSTHQMITIKGVDFDNGTYDGTTGSLINGNITMIDDGSIATVSNFDDNGNYSIAMSDDFKSGPGEMIWDLDLGAPSETCGGLLMFTVNSGHDNNFNAALDTSEIETTIELCQTNQTIVGGNGLPPLGDVNGTVQNGSLEVEPTALPVGDVNCPNGGTFFEWGNDFGMFYDRVMTLNSTEIEGSFYFCQPLELWFGTLLDFNGTITGTVQQLAHGTVPASAASGEVVAATLPGQPVPPGSDGWLLLPTLEIPADSGTFVNYSFSFDHWHDLESGDGAWVEHRMRNGSSWSNWTWTPLDTGYSHTIPEGDLDVEGTPTDGTIPVFGGDTYSGWISASTNLSNLDSITENSVIQFRFRIVTSDSSTGSPGWFIDNIDYNNDGDASGAWHHGCDVNGYSAYNYGTYCGYANNQINYLTHSGLDLTGASDIEFDLHWDLEGSGWDNLCIELSNNNGASWIDITSASNSTTTQCRSRSGNIPGYGYTDINGVNHLDDSGGMVTISASVPTAHQVSNAVLRYHVQTDASVTGGSPTGSTDSDGREGVTVFGFRPMDASGMLYSVYLDPSTPTTGSNTNEWQWLTLTSGYISEEFGFEDSQVTEPESDDMDGFTRTTTKSNCNNDYTCGWDLGPIQSSTFGPSEAASFPYVYSIGTQGSFNGAVEEASLITPEITVPDSGVSFFSFDMWICWHYYYSWSNRHYHGGALMVQVNNGTWEHVDPGNWYTDNDVMTTYTSGTAYPSTPLDGERIWTDEHCDQEDFENYELSMEQWAGENIRFKFIAADKYSYSTTAHGPQGWFIDNVATRIGSFNSPGNWISQDIQLDGIDDFNLGIVEVEAKVDDNSTLTASVLDSTTGVPIIGYESLDFPINLAGIDVDSHPSINVRLELDSSSSQSTPIVHNLEIGGPRILSPELLDFNGWSIPSGIEIVDGLFNATLVTSTISSDYQNSIKPIQRINFNGNASNNVIIDVLDSNGNSIGNTSFGGHVAFSYPINGYSLEITLPPNGYIETMRIKSVYAEPARDISIDVAEDGNDNWDFYYAGGRGHLGWQTNMLDQAPSTSNNPISSTSMEFYLTAGVPQSVTVLIPEGSMVHSGLLAITSDADGFDSSINLDVNGYQSTISTTSSHLTYHRLSPNQAASISAMGASWTDTNSNDRMWKEVTMTFESSATQTISLSRFAISYSVTETVSNLATELSIYKINAAAENPTLVNINIPTNLSSSAGQVVIDGQITHELLIKNKDFNVPNAFYPDGSMYEIVTSHRHLYDNSNLASITLDGIGSDGETISFEAINSPDGSWGVNSGSVTFQQTSGNELMHLDEQLSQVAIVDGGDGWMDVQVSWKFELSWNWDDVNKINWISQAMDTNGESIWPAGSVSGALGNAVENDLQIDHFEIRDQNDRLISNQFSPFYPHPISEGSQINVSGSVRFQDTEDTTPLQSDFQVRVNISGSIYLLESLENGEFSGTFNAPAGMSEISVTPDLFRVGPLSGSIGAMDESGQPPTVTIVNDFTPPIVGPLQVMTPSGLQNANGKVWDPSMPLSFFVTLEENEARGETITLRYWRADVDDTNMNGIAEEDEYLSQTQPLTAGMVGQEQVNFAAIDVSSQQFNSPVYAYLEGIDWAGLSYQEGGTGGGPGAANSWASVIVAIDEPTTIVPNGYELDSYNGYLLAGNMHVFRMQINEPNGLQTLDNVTIMLCGDRLDNLGKISYNPSSDELWTPVDSMVNAISMQTQSITSSVTELALVFEISWDYSWEEGQYSCKPAVSIIDEVTEVAYQDNIGEISWILDNTIIAIPNGINDLTTPIMSSNDLHLYLQAGDQFSMDGGLFYAQSGEIFNDIKPDMQVEIEVLYGGQFITSIASINDDGTWFGSMTIESFTPPSPTMNVSTSVLYVPGLGGSLVNSDAKITVDSKDPTILFDQIAYPDSSLTVLESDLLGEVLVTITMVDEIGMPESDLEVAWLYISENQPVIGTESTGTLRLLDDGMEIQNGEESFSGQQVFQGTLDLRPMLEDFDIKMGDRIMFWVTSTDRAGNEVIGLGSYNNPKTVALRIMEFNPALDNIVITPKNPLTDTTVTVETYWSNSGKRSGSIEINLYELIDEQWQQPDSSSIQLELDPETSSVYAKFEWVAGEIEQPVLYIIIDKDFQNGEPVIGIQVTKPITDEGGSEDTTTYIIIGGIFLVAVAMVGFFMSRSRSDDEEYYYDDEDDSYYDDEDDSYYEDEYEEE